VQGFLYSGKEYVCAMQLHADVPEQETRRVSANEAGGPDFLAEEGTIRVPLIWYTVHNRVPSSASSFN
jgi:hypothetical protein